MINYLFCLIRKLFLRSPSQLLDMSKVKSLGRIPLETSGALLADRVQSTEVDGDSLSEEQDGSGPPRS